MIVHEDREGKKVSFKHVNCYSHQSIEDVKNNISVKESDPLYLLEKVTYKGLFSKYFKKKSDILDAAGGWGRHALTLAELGHDVTMVDSSPQQIKGARYYLKEFHQAKNIRIIKRKFGAKSRTKLGNFHHVVCLDSVLSCGNCAEILQELSAVLRKKGFLIVTVVSREYFINSKIKEGDFFNKYGLALCPRAQEVGWGQCFIKTFSKAEFKKVLNEYGLEFIDSFGLHEGILKGMGKKRALLDKYASVSRPHLTLEESITRKFSHQMVVIAKKK